MLSLSHAVSVFEVISQILLAWIHEKKMLFCGDRTGGTPVYDISVLNSKFSYSKLFFKILKIVLKI